MKPVACLAGVYYQGMPGFSYIRSMRMTVYQEIVMTAVGQRIYNVMFMYHNNLFPEQFELMRLIKYPFFGHFLQEEFVSVIVTVYTGKTA